MKYHQNQEKIQNAIKVARMYYYQNMKTDAIAMELKVSRSTVSRMLSFAKDEGYVEIKVATPTQEITEIEKSIGGSFGIERIHVVPVPDIAGEAVWLDLVAQYAANHLNSVIGSGMILGIAWGTTLSAISRHLLKKSTHNLQIVQLNGAGNIKSTGINYASEILMRFAANYQARVHLFPVPTFFDYAETKQALWRERSIKRILNLQEKADVLLYSIGAVSAGIPSHVYSAGYLEQKDYQELKRENIVGDIATVFFRENGSSHNIPINERASGPNLDMFRLKHGICVVSGLAKVNGLLSALRGRLMSELIVDEPTARALVSKIR
ncbi:MAG: sugar-binding domain-containing protein [Anaerolineales bacterium]|nr:sugar-binding domain-containing protein [Anaerolineales bacterium]